MSKAIAFSRGPYGEIYPPPLLDGITPDDAICILRDAIQQLGEGGSLPEDDDSKPYVTNLALLYVHQLRLSRALAGQGESDTERALHQAVVVDRSPLSLRPLGLENLSLPFAPVLQRLDDQEWQVGVYGHGRVGKVKAKLQDVVKRAQALYVRWCEEEEKKKEQAKGARLSDTYRRAKSNN